MDHGYSTLGLDMFMQQGMSGGPLVGADRRVAGMNVSTDEMYSYAIGADSIRDWLRGLDEQRQFGQATQIGDIATPEAYRAIEEATLSRSMSIEFLSGRNLDNIQSSMQGYFDDMLEVAASMDTLFGGMADGLDEVIEEVRGFGQFYGELQVPEVEKRIASIHDYRSGLFGRIEELTRSYDHI